MRKILGEHQTIITKYWGHILFTLMLVMAIFSYDNYGVSWDEPIQKITGEVNYNYVFHNDDALLSYKDRYYGVAFELPLVIFEKVLGLKDTRDIYLMRHFLMHLFFLFSAFIFFKLIYLLYKNTTLATVGFLFLVLHPRIYGHSFFNSKDIPFMSMLIICFYLTALAFNQKKIRHFLVLGISIGLLINLRIMGILLPCILLCYLLLDAIIEKKNIENLKLAIVLTLFSSITLYCFWPILWGDPIGNFILAFEEMSKFPWGYSVLFNGDVIKGTELSWYYIPEWFLITTPIVFLFFGILGIILFSASFLKEPLKHLRNDKVRNNLLYLSFFFVPLIAVIILNSVLYDSWRQMFFIYPSFILLAIFGLKILFEIRVKNIVKGTLVISFISISLFTILNYPFNYVYFNQFISKSNESIRKSFEMDYWGLSYKQSYEYILANDDSPQINIGVENLPGRFNLFILPPDDRKRINIVDKENAQYFVSCFRWRHKGYPEYSEFKYHSIKIDNSTISEIYKLK